MKTEILWTPVDDGFGIVGYSWKCPACGEHEVFGDYWKDEVKCEKCGETFLNTSKPE